MKKRMCCLAMAASILLCSCAANPEQDVVISKNDGSFDVNVFQSATQPTEAIESATQDEPIIQEVQYEDSFTSPDGSVQFQLSIDDTIPVQALPVVEIVPHYLTTEDAERVANALFDNAEFYELRPLLSAAEKRFSKLQIQERIGKCQKWLDWDYMTDLYGDAERAENEIETVKHFIEEYSEAFDAAPEKDPRVPCEWTFKPSSFYYYPQAELSDIDTSDDNLEIQAEVVANGLDYNYSVFTRNEDDFKINNINLTLGSQYGPGTIEYDELIAKLCRTDKPTDEQTSAVRNKAERILSKMDLGDWLIDQCYVRTFTHHGSPEYYICVKAVPTFQGVAALRRQQLGNLRSTEADASNYYLTDVEFMFSANGDLISFSLYSSIDTKQIINESTTVFSMDKLIERAKQQVSFSDSKAYYLHASFIEMYEKAYGENIICRINITQMDYGLTRVKVPNTDDSYYYVPALMLSGSIEYCGKNTGNVYDSYSQIKGTDELYPLVCLNAIDGSVIELQNPSPT